jgi:hypothetical protein
MYELFIFLIFKFFGGRDKLEIAETADTEPLDVGARLCYVNGKVNLVPDQHVTEVRILCGVRALIYFVRLLLRAL